MKSQLLPALALAGLGAAQSSTTISLFLPDTDPQNLVASVVAADATATTYAMSCLPGTDASNCGYSGGATVIEGPSTLQLILLSSNGPLETIACDLAGTTQAVCTASQTLNGYSTSQVVTSTLGPADMTFFPVGITAGAEKLAPASGSVSATASRTSGEASGASTTTDVVGSVSLAGSATAEASTSMTGLVSSSGGTAASGSVASATAESSMSQTHSASSPTSSSHNAAFRTSEMALSLPFVVARSLLGGLVAVVFF